MTELIVTTEQGKKRVEEVNRRWVEYFQMIGEKLLKRARVDEGHHDDVKENRATDKERVEASGSGLSDEQRAAGRGEQEARQQLDVERA